MKRLFLFVCVFTANYIFAERITFPTPSAMGRISTMAVDGAVHRGVCSTPQQPSTLFFTNIIPEMDLKKITFQGHDFTALYLAGYVFHGRAGYPKLPAKTQLLEIPMDADVEITILSSEYMDIPLNERGFKNQLFPVQPRVRKSATSLPALAKNHVAYSQTTFSSRDLVDVEILGIMRDRRFAQLNILPVRYLASKNVIRVYYFVEFRVDFVRFMNVGADSLSTVKSSAPTIHQPQTKNFYNYHTTKTVPNSKLYKIISDRKFENTLIQFIDWKIELGFDVWASFTDQPEVGNTATSIRAFLKDIFENGSQRKDYLLLVGDVNKIPAFPTKFPAYSQIIWDAGGTHVTDFYFAEYTGDNLPDVFYGRLSASTLQDLQNQIEKIIKMEQLAVPSTEFLGNSLLIAGWDPFFSNRRMLTRTITYAQEYYFNSRNNINATVLLSSGFSGIEETNLIIRTINEGVGFVNYTGHGNWNEWQGPRMTIAEINNLTNFDRYPVVISNACLTNQFDRPLSFGEALVRAERRGAVAHIGASNSTFFVEDFLWSIGAIHTFPFNPDTITFQNSGLGVFDRIFHPNENKRARSLGEIVFSGNMAVQLSNATLDDETKLFYWEVYHILGDPSFRPHFFDPNNPPTSTEVRSFDDVGFDVFLRNDGQLHVRIETETSSNVTILLTNTLGQTVKVKRGLQLRAGEPNDFYFDVSNFPRGLYICTVLTGNRVVSRKFVW